MHPRGKQHKALKMSVVLVVTRSPLHSFINPQCGGLTFLASSVRGLVPARSVNQLLMELWDLAVTSQKLSFWLTCGLRFPVSGNVL